MTSNAGSNLKSGTVGFSQTASEQKREQTLKALSDFLRPEFINRIDEIVVFNPLSREHFKSIANIMLSDLTASLSEKQISLSYDESVTDYLSDKSFSEKYGARNLRRTIQKELEDVIANLIIENYEKNISKVAVSAKDGELDVRAL